MRLRRPSQTLMAVEMTKIVSLAVLSFTTVAAFAQSPVTNEQAVRLVAELTHDISVKNDLMNGRRKVDSFVSPDGTRMIVMTTHRELKTNRVVRVDENEKFVGHVCIERFALAPNKDMIAAQSDEECTLRNDSAEL